MSKLRGPYRVDPLGYKKKAMKLALEALKESIDVPCYGGHPKQEAAYRLLQEALAEQPAQRTWVGLTDADWGEINDMPDTFDQGVAWAQARLKDKNT